MKYLYLVLGMVFSFNATIWLIEPYQHERDVTITKIQSLQSCYFTATKFAKMGHEESAKFCEAHSAETTENFTDIAVQMDQMTDEMYSPVNYYSKKVKSWWK